MLRIPAYRILKWLSESQGHYWHHLPSPSAPFSLSASRLSANINPQVMPENSSHSEPKSDHTEESAANQELGDEDASTRLETTEAPKEVAGISESVEQEDAESTSFHVKTEGLSSGLEQEPEVPVEEQRSLRVAIVGAPNAGKSTLINQLLGQKVLAVSPKAHTTSRRALGVFTKGSAQIELTDTPGLIPISYARSLRMSREFTVDPGRSLLNADLVAVMVDASNKLKREQLDLSVLRLLEKFPSIPSVLILNKVDLVRKKTILLKLAEYLTGSEETDRHRMGYLVRRWRDERVPVSQKMETKQELDKLRKELAARKKLKEDRLKSLEKAQLERDGQLSDPEEDETKEKQKQKQSKQSSPVLLNSPPSLVRSCWPYFKEVFMISALDGDGVSKLTEYFFDSAKPRRWDYSVHEVTDQPALSLVEDIIREKICIHTEKEIPYVVKQENIIWELDESGGITIYQYIHCGKRSRAAILIGSKGSMINTIRDEATMDIEALLKCPINLTLHVKK